MRKYPADIERQILAAEEKIKNGWQTKVLLEGDKIISKTFKRATFGFTSSLQWVLSKEDQARFGRNMIPFYHEGRKSSIQSKLGLRQDVRTISGKVVVREDISVDGLTKRFVVEIYPA